MRLKPLHYFGGAFVVAKPFKTLDEQITLLASRGIIIGDVDRAKSYLLSGNYYNIVNGYGRYFPKNRDVYTGNTTFDEITRLYLFDKELKQLFFRAILAIEGHLKSIYAYRFAEAYPNSPYAYLYVSNYEHSKMLSAVDTIYRISKIINYHKKTPGNSIYHYTKNHNDVPVWVLISYLNFGEVRHMLNSSCASIQNSVAKDMCEFIKQHQIKHSVFPLECMLNFLADINDIRNVCAHNGRLLDFKGKHDIKYWAPLHSKYNITPQNTTRRTDVYNVFLTTQCFLSKTEYGFLHNGIRKAMNSHLKKHITSLSVDTILNILGFPNNWNSTAKISQKV